MPERIRIRRRPRRRMTTEFFEDSRTNRRRQRAQDEAAHIAAELEEVEDSVREALERFED